MAKDRREARPIWPSQRFGQTTPAGRRTLADGRQTLARAQKQRKNKVKPLRRKFGASKRESVKMVKTE